MPAPFNRKLPWGRCTKKVEGNKTFLYLHVFDWPSDGQLLVPGLKNKIQRAYVLGDKSRSKLVARNVEDGVLLTVPSDASNAISTTVVLQIKGELLVSRIPEPKTTASNMFQNQTNDYGAQFAFDGELGTRWATDDATKQAWIAIDFLKPQTFDSVRIFEAHAGRVQKFAFQYLDHGQWQTIFDGTTLGENFQKDLRQSQRSNSGSTFSMRPWGQRSTKLN
ncbi:MAG: discoidin domain-containing protein [Limisphaerales bacterium]